MTSIVPFLSCLFWYGPAGTLLLVSLILEQQRYAPNGTQPQANIVMRNLVGGISVALVWVAFAAVLTVVSGRAGAGLWIAATPWAFALGEAVGLIWKPARSRTC